MDEEYAYGLLDAMKKEFKDKIEQLENENKELRDKIAYLELPDTYKQE